MSLAMDTVELELDVDTPDLLAETLPDLAMNEAGEVVKIPRTKYDRFVELVRKHGGAENVNKRCVVLHSGRWAKSGDPMTWREWLYFRSHHCVILP
jgi:hypothetical protein